MIGSHKEELILSSVLVISLIIILTGILIGINESYWQYCKYHSAEKSYLIDIGISMRNHHINYECK